MITMLWGAGIGFGLVGMVIGLRPARRSLAQARQVLMRPDADVPSTAALATVPTPSLRAKLTGPPARMLGRWGLPGARFHDDLQMAGIDAETFLANKVFGAVVGLFLPMILQVVFLSVGVMLPPMLLVIAGLTFAVALFFVPDREVRANAATRREEARHALDMLLSFTSTSLAAGDGIEAALEGSASIGTGSAFAEFRQAGVRARMSRRPIWECYGELARSLGLAELDELAATAELAGGEGARIADSLAAKAASLRGRMAADRVAKTVTVTEKMQVPVGLMMIGFLAVMAFPAMSKLLVSM